jgi:hypothetical protein
MATVLLTEVAAVVEVVTHLLHQIIHLVPVVKV